MRHLLLPFAAFTALAACNAEPCSGGDSNCVVATLDAGLVDTGTDLGTDAGPADLGFDVAHDDLTIVDVHHASVDVGTDAGTPDVVDLPTDRGPTEDCASHLEPCFCPDGTSSTHDPCVTEWCSCDGHMGPPDAGHLDTGTDTGPADTGVDVPADVRINCAPIGGTDIPCHSHADCAQCIPGAFNSIWCCAASGVCAGTSDPTCH